MSTNTPATDRGSAPHVDAELPTLAWHGCYDGSWQSATLIPEAYSHPAKISFALAERIYRHMLAEGWLRPGDRVIDPFGGIGGCAFHAALYGLHWTGVELEPKFCELGDMEYACPGFSKDFWRRYHKRPGYIAKLRAAYKLCPSCETALAPKTVLQKRKKHDNRPRFVIERVIPEQAAHIYRGNIPLWRERYAPVIASYGTASIVQGDSRNLLAILAAADGLVASPPYTASEVASRAPSGADVTARKIKRANDDWSGYGSTPGQLGAMPAGVVSSPPYQTGGHHDGVFDTWGGEIGKTDTPAWSRLAKKSPDNGYGEASGQMGSMPSGDYSSVVSSPPYETSRTDGEFQRHAQDPDFSLNMSESAKGYGDSGIGRERTQEAADTFWLAARTILEQTYVILKPGAVAAWVTGDFVRNKQRVTFGQQWLALCEAVGFAPLAHAIAWKQTDHGAQMDIFGQAVSQGTTKVSFFRRLSNAKNPDAAILNEDVWFVRKPNA